MGGVGVMGKREEGGLGRQSDFSRCRGKALWVWEWKWQGGWEGGGWVVWVGVGTRVGED